VAYRKHRARPRPLRLALGLVLGLTAALAIAGCTSAPAASTAAGPARTAAPGTTPAQARQVFSAYAETAAKASRTKDKTLALSVVTGVQRAVLAATLGRHTVTEQGTPASAAYSSMLTITPDSGSVSYGTPAFYLPERAGYPRFFVAAVRQAVPDVSGSHPATLTGGTAVPVDGTALLLFEQASVGAPWLLASSSSLAAGEALPKLATDSAGYVPVVPPTAAALLARPDSVGALQAAVVDDGPASAAARTVAAGPLTTGMYAGAQGHADGLHAPAGDVYQWELEGSSLPEFALRTSGGGALTFYAMSLTETVAVPSVISKADPVLSGPPIQIPPVLLTLLPKGQQAPLIALSSQQTLSFAAVDPSSAEGKIQVIAIGGGLTAASAT
jgi:hypothetical protein